MLGEKGDIYILPAKKPRVYGTTYGCAGISGGSFFQES